MYYNLKQCFSVEVTIGFNSQHYSAVEGGMITIEVKASRTAGVYYKIYVVIPKNNLTSKNVLNI